MTAVCHETGGNHPQNPHEYRGIMTYYSHRNLRRPGPLRPAPVDAFQQHRQLRTRQTNGPFCSLRPDESSSFKTLGKQTQPVTIEPENLHHVATASSENEDVTGERLLVEHRLHLRAQTVEATPHVGHAGCEPDLRPGAKFNHLRRLSRIERSNAGSAPLSTLIIARPGNSMWIEPDVAGCCWLIGSRVSASLGAATVTGSKAVDARLWNPPTRPARKHAAT
jgi:hypothetical protein